MTVNLRHLEILYGVAGAREKFEEMTVHLIRSQHPTAERVRIVRGDGGIDAHHGSLANPDGVDVFQMKYFPIGIDEAQRNQIRESFKRVRDNKDFKTKSWTLCLPIDLSVDEKKWFDEWAAKQRPSGIELAPVWGATQIERLLMLPENQEIRETYFQQEHLQRIREMGGHMRQLLDEFIDRVPKPEPVVLEAMLDAVKSRRCYRFDAEHVVAEVQLCFTVRNTSDNQSAQGWSVMVGVNLSPDICMTRKTFPRIGEGPSYFRLDNTLLPLHEATTESLFGIKVKSKKVLEPQLRRLLEATVATFRAVSHNHTGPEVQVKLGDVIDWPSLLTGVEQAFLADIKDYPGKEPE